MTRLTAARLLLAVAALLLLFGGAIHATAFPKVAPVLDSASIPIFLIGASKALWLADSSNLFAVGAAFGLVAAHPRSGGRALILVLALVPFASAILIYAWVGAFFAGHLMLVA